MVICLGFLPKVTVSARCIRRLIPFLVLLHGLGHVFLSMVPTTTDGSGSSRTDVDPYGRKILNHSGVLSNPTPSLLFTRTRQAYAPHAKTLALLYPQGMIGGYRNQVIRFTALIAHARMNSIPQLLLPSIVWSTTYKEANDEHSFFPVPMDLLFDVEYWNSFRGHLPILVDSLHGDSDCWDLHKDKDTFDFDLEKSLSAPRNRSFTSPMTATLLERSALLTPVLNTSRAYLTGNLGLKPRQLDLYPQVNHCKNPVVYGGGQGFGRMWTLYMSLSKGGLKTSTNLTELVSWVSKALLPSPKWRDMAHQCIRQHTTTTTNKPVVVVVGSATKDSSDKQQPPLRDDSSGYVALHARVEVDMMVHKCGRNMEKNLTKIFSMVDDLMLKYNNHQEPTTHDDKLQGIFVAVSRRGMLRATRNTRVKRIADDNWKTLIERSVSDKQQTSDMILGSNNADTNKPAVFECGESWMERWYSMQTEVEDDYYGSLVPSIMNFYIATNATIFVGVAGSSWSTDVWTNRYYQGRGDTNFQYTPAGIIPIPNSGLPDGHKKC
eukprot:scaffold108265_cov34-Attheya_sp.AAC.2